VAHPGTNLNINFAKHVSHGNINLHALAKHCSYQHCASCSNPKQLSTTASKQGTVGMQTDKTITAAAVQGLSCLYLSNACYSNVTHQRCMT
jgi:hypothetical protein